jgi:ATP adenylyltransferase
VTGTHDRPGCVFCGALDDEDRDPLVLLRGETCFVVLNRYPYNNGHLMVSPRRHVASLSALSEPELSELMQLTQHAEIAIQEIYQPHGLNVGINLGRAAGAGIVDHMHVHVVPRWNGDTNFMTVVGNVRVLPEELPETANRLRPVFERLSARV